MTVVSRLAALAALVALSACGRNQKEGRYTLTQDRLLRDDCRMSQDPGVPGSLDLLVVGETVRLDYSFLDMQLLGNFLAGTEGFYADGSSANVARVVNGRECLLDQATTHLDAT